MRRIGFILSFFISLVQADDLKDDILSMDQRAVVRDGFLKDRFETVLPEIMARNNMDMWIIIAREYNEDPVIRTMLPATWLNARRRTILVIRNPGNGLRHMAQRSAANNLSDTQPGEWPPARNLCRSSL